MVEPDLLLTTAFQRDAQAMGVLDFCQTLQMVHLPVFDELTGPSSQTTDDGVFEAAELVEVDFRLAELNAPSLGVPRFGDQFGHMQPRFRRNAAAINAHAAGIDLGIDERDLHAQVGREKSGRVPTWAAANDGQLRGEHGRSDWSRPAGAAGRA